MNLTKPLSNTTRYSVQVAARVRADRLAAQALSSTSMGGSLSQQPALKGQSCQGSTDLPKFDFLSSNVIAANPALVQSKFQTFVRDGPSRLFVVADFDHTLTLPGGLSSWSIVDTSSRMSAEYKQQCASYAAKYYPVELSLTLSAKEKAPVLTHWFKLVQSTLAAQKVTTSKLREVYSDALPMPSSQSSSSSTLSSAPAFSQTAVLSAPGGAHSGYASRAGVMKVREGFEDLTRLLFGADVPFAVVSAGIGNFISQCLINNGVSRVIPIVTNDVDAESLKPTAATRRSGTVYLAANMMVPRNGSTNSSSSSNNNNEGDGACAAADAGKLEGKAAEEYLASLNAHYMSSSFKDGDWTGYAPPSPIHVYNKCDIPTLTSLQAKLLAAAAGKTGSTTTTTTIGTSTSIGGSASHPHCHDPAHRSTQSSSTSSPSTSSPSTSSSSTSSSTVCSQPVDAAQASFLAHFGASTAGGHEEGHNVLLLGDSTGDVTIAGSLPLTKTFLSVGFLNVSLKFPFHVYTDATLPASLVHVKGCQAQTPAPVSATPALMPAAPATTKPPAKTGNGKRNGNGGGGADSEEAVEQENAGEEPGTTAEVVQKHERLHCDACMVEFYRGRLALHLRAFDVVVLGDRTLNYPLHVVNSVIEGAAKK